MAYDWAPSVEDVGALLRARTIKSETGEELGTFTDETRPTSTAVVSLIDAATDDVVSAVGGRGWAFIAIAASLKSLRVTGSLAFARAVLEGYRLGRRAGWLLGEDYEELLHEPIDAARARLGIGEPRRYLACNPMQEWTA